MSDCPKCEKCGLELTTGLMAGLCQYARQCPMWPHSNGDKELQGGELLMAYVWMDNACEQIGLQIDERKRLEAENARLVSCLSDSVKWKDRYKDECVIVDRVWRALGIESYEAAGGQHIDELVRGQVVYAVPLTEAAQALLVQLDHIGMTREETPLMDALRAALAKNPNPTGLSTEASVAERPSRIPEASGAGGAGTLRMACYCIDCGSENIGECATRTQSGTKSDAWQQAVIDSLVVRHIYRVEHDADPMKALTDLILWEVDVALDDAVSERAAALKEQGRVEVRQRNQVVHEVTDAMAEHFCKLMKWDPDGTENRIVGYEWRSTTFRELAKGYIRAALEASRTVAAAPVGGTGVWECTCGVRTPDNPLYCSACGRKYGSRFVAGTKS